MYTILRTKPWRFNGRVPCARWTKRAAGTTHFGYQDIPENEKKEKVGEVFHRVAEKYDCMNDAMSLGVHRLWKDRMVKLIHPLPGQKFLDVAGGTGDIAFRVVDALQTSSLAFSADVQEMEGNKHAKGSVHVVDINPSMVQVGQERAQARYPEALRNGMLSFSTADAEMLPFEENSFDVYTIAFGIRNCTHVDKVLSEAHRVLKPGGRFVCLEFSHISKERYPLLRKIYDRYSFSVIPLLGEAIAQDRASYQYLVESIRRFPDQDAFADMIRTAGFEEVLCENMNKGLVAIHDGFKNQPKKKK